MDNATWQIRLAWRLARFLLCEWTKVHAWTITRDDGWWCVLCGAAEPDWERENYFAGINGVPKGGLNGSQ